MKSKVLRLDLWIDRCFDELLREQADIDLAVLKLSDPDDVNWALLAGTDIYHVSAAKDEVPQQWQVTPELIARCPRLKVVSSTGAGYDTVDVAACTRAGILVVNQAGGNANSVAEHTFALMLAVCRRITESDRLLKAGARIVREDLMGHELAGKVLGIVGLGHCGGQVARLAAAFGMQVLAYDPLLDDATVRARGATAVTLEQLLAQSDVVSLHCPRNSDTLGMFDATAFQAMKPGALFISTARGGIHDEAALHAALACGHLGGAGLDVWQVEPPAQDHPLLTLPNVVATYHTAGVTHEGRRNIARIGALQIIDICAGKRPGRIINPEVYDTFAGRFPPAKGVRAPTSQGH